MGTGTAVSVIVIVLSIGIHQYNPFIIPKILGKALHCTRIGHKLLIDGYDQVKIVCKVDLGCIFMCALNLYTDYEFHF
jgi:hypothetical protein